MNSCFHDGKIITNLCFFGNDLIRPKGHLLLD
jgi:formylmethanofuran dehydrogenase subunit E